MFILLLIIVIIISAHARHTYIVGGSEAEVGVWKYQISLRIFGHLMFMRPNQYVYSLISYGHYDFSPCTCLLLEGHRLRSEHASLRIFGQHMCMGSKYCAYMYLMFIFLLTMVMIIPAHARHVYIVGGSGGWGRSMEIPD